MKVPQLPSHHLTFAQHCLLHSLATGHWWLKTTYKQKLLTESVVSSVPHSFSVEHLFFFLSLCYLKRAGKCMELSWGPLIISLRHNICKRSGAPIPPKELNIVYSGSVFVQFKSAERCQTLSNKLCVVCFVGLLVAESSGSCLREVLWRD